MTQAPQPNRPNSEDRSRFADPNAFFCIANKPWPAMSKVRLCGVVGAFWTYSCTESVSAAAAVVAVIVLYAIGWLLQSIHGILSDLHRRMDVGFPPKSHTPGT